MPAIFYAQDAVRAATRQTLFLLRLDRAG